MDVFGSVDDVDGVRVNRGLGGIVLVGDGE